MTASTPFASPASASRPAPPTAPPARPSPAAAGGRQRHPNRRPDRVHKPAGVIHPRVQAVGPERFGVVSVDCAKARSKWMLADFYGHVILPPAVVEHTAAGLADAVASLRQAVAARGLGDLIVAVERTGRYHHPVQRAFAAAGFEARTVHPFATKQFRQPADPGVKTDDTDLHAIHRAAVNGFALLEAQWDSSWRELQLLTRHRRDLVNKASTLCLQIKEHLDAALPGYAACFPALWEHPAALHLALRVDGAAGLLAAGRSRMAALLRDAAVRFQGRTLDKVLAWAGGAAPPDVAASFRRRLASELEADRARKALEIQGLEREIASRLCATPYALLMTIPGVNVVSAAEYAAEMGPIHHYANARCITGRAGLYPSRSQSDRQDVSGPMVRCANRRLRFALLQIADNLITCNHYFMLLASCWRERGSPDPRLLRVRVAHRFARISFHMVAGRSAFAHPVACAAGRGGPHPSTQGRDYLLRKLIAFHRDHGTAALDVQRDLHAAARQLRPADRAAEVAPLREELQRIQQRARGPQPLADVLPIILASIAVAPGGNEAERKEVKPEPPVIQSPPSGSSGPA